jgi:hypothetical protein
MFHRNGGRLRYDIPQDWFLCISHFRMVNLARQCKYPLEKVLTWRYLQMKVRPRSRPVGGLYSGQGVIYVQTAASSFGFVGSHQISPFSFGRSFRSRQLVFVSSPLFLRRHTFDCFHSHGGNSCGWARPWCPRGQRRVIVRRNSNCRKNHPRVRNVACGPGRAALCPRTSYVRLRNYNLDKAEIRLHTGVTF